MRTITKTNAFVGTVVMALGGTALGMTFALVQPAPAHAETIHPIVTIQEDTSGWDCQDMGNTVCSADRVWITSITGTLKDGFTYYYSDGHHAREAGYRVLLQECTGTPVEVAGCQGYFWGHLTTVQTMKWALQHTVQR